MSVSEEKFRAALSRFASGVTVVSTRDNAGRLHGLTVSAFCSVSLNPPMVLICVEKSTASHYAFSESSIFTVSILNESHGPLSEHFATELEDKFFDLVTQTSANGLPCIENATAVLDCKVRFAHDGGDHTIFVGEVENVKLGEAFPLVYFRSQYRKLDA